MIPEIPLHMSIPTILLGLPLILAGTFLLWRAVAIIHEARRASSWPAHPATVLSSGTSTIGLYRTFPSGGVSRRLDIRYEWKIDGLRYEGTRERFTIWRLGGQTPAATHAALANAMPGATIEIRVDPNDSRNAVVHPKVDQAAVLSALLLGLLFTGYGLWLVVEGLGLTG